MGSPGRREIGHGKLAWRAIRPMLPPAHEFPYTHPRRLRDHRVERLVLDGDGVRLLAGADGRRRAAARPVAGIAMGLILEGERFAVLSDILGDEDHLGDMDFKVAGTEHGITSLQMDIKIAGITEEIMRVALAQAKEGRMHILGEMTKALTAPRAELGEYAPRIETIKIPTDKIREVIGTGGKVIREIVEKTGAKIDIEDDGTVKVASADAQRHQGGARLDQVDRLRARARQIYDGTVVKTIDFGAFVNFFGAEGRPGPYLPARAQPRQQGHRRRQGRRQGQGEAPRLRRARQGPPVDEGRRPADRRGPDEKQKAEREAERNRERRSEPVVK